MRQKLFAFRHVCALALLLGPSDASAETRFVRAGDDLQVALNASLPGDVLLLEAGATFVGNFVLPVKSGASYITVRTETGSLTLPGPGQRISPADAPGLAKLRSPNSLSVLQTAPAAHHWRLQLLEFQANQDGHGDMIRLGDGNQSSLADVPYELELDRVYIHGDPLRGQKRGISLQSASTRIVNSFIADIKAVGMDTQTIGGWNGPGPYVIENNYLEAAGENVMFGGADPKITDLVPSDISFRRNHVRKPVAWRQPLVSTPTGVALTGLPGGGTLAAATYGYRVAARRSAGQGTWATSAASPEITATLGSTGAVRITWAVVPDATEYRVYRHSGTTWQFWTVTTTTFTDTGTNGTSGTPPGTGTVWTVKNLFELKNARRVAIEGNVFENNWLAAQTGYGILLKSSNQDGQAPWSVVENVTFSHNIVRNVASAINLLGHGISQTSQQMNNITIRHNLIYGVDSTVWGGDGRFLMIGEAPANVTVDHNTVMHNGTVVMVYGRNSDGSFRVVDGFQYTNNLSLHNLYGIKGDGAAVGNGTISAYFPDGIVMRNVLAGGNASQYPADNEFPSVTAFHAEFVDADYHLRPDSPYVNAGTDGADLGADIDAVLALTRSALAGGGSPPVAPHNARVVGGA